MFFCDTGQEGNIVQGLGAWSKMEKYYIKSSPLRVLTHDAIFHATPQKLYALQSDTVRMIARDIAKVELAS